MQGTTWVLTVYDMEKEEIRVEQSGTCLPWRVGVGHSRLDPSPTTTCSTVILLP